MDPEIFLPPSMSADLARAVNALATVLECHAGRATAHASRAAIKREFDEINIGTVRRFSDELRAAIGRVDGVIAAEQADLNQAAE